MPEARQLWQTALGELQLLMTRANYETWLKHSEGLGFDGDVLRVGVKSPFTQEALATRFAPLVRRTLASVVGRPLEVRYEVASAEPVPAAPLFQADRAPHPASRPSQRELGPAAGPDGRPPGARRSQL